MVRSANMRSSHHPQQEPTPTGYDIFGFLGMWQPLAFRFFWAQNVLRPVASSFPGEVMNDDRLVVTKSDSSIYCNGNIERLLPTSSQSKFSTFLSVCCDLVNLSLLLPCALILIPSIELSRCSAANLDADAQSRRPRASSGAGVHVAQGQKLSPKKCKF